MFAERGSQQIFKMAAARGGEKDAVNCSCSELNYVHKHCPCRICCGKAVSKRTERRHWESANALHGVTRPRPNAVTAMTDPYSATHDKRSKTKQLLYPLALFVLPVTMLQ